MTHPTLAFERDFTISPAKLWHLLTDANMREKWGAPSEDAILTMEETDFREGGFERHRCGPKDNPEFHVETRWYKIDAPEMACFTETIDVPGMRLFTSLVTYNVTETPAGAALKIDVAVSGFTGEDVSADVQQGWEGGLASLEKLAQAQA